MDEDLVLGLFLILPLLFGGMLLFFARHLRTRKSKARWPQLIEGNALILLLLLAVFVLGGEIYFRFLYDTTDSL